jgi:hypothetical protein
MNVAAELLALAGDRRSIAVVGTSKNAGKTVVIAALCEEFVRRGEPYGLLSVGRDGESVDALEGTPKPRLFLREGTLFATARPLVPAHPAAEVLASGTERGALGTIVVARMRRPGFVEIAGPASAAGARRVVAALFALGAHRVAIDGAVDRSTALRPEDATIVATGAASGTTIAQVAEAAAGLVQRLALPVVDRELPFIRHAGALSASAALAYARAGERAQILVDDPTRVAIGGRSFSGIARSLDLRVERTLTVIAATVASAGPERAFEPRALASAVARATALPVFDVYAATASSAA